MSIWSPFDRKEKPSREPKFRAKILRKISDQAEKRLAQPPGAPSLSHVHNKDDTTCESTGARNGVRNNG